MAWSQKYPTLVCGRTVQYREATERESSGDLELGGFDGTVRLRGVGNREAALPHDISCIDCEMKIGALEAYRTKDNPGPFCRACYLERTLGP